MAITVVSSPETYPSASNDIWYAVTSTNVAQSNFKFIFDVYINASFITRLRIFPDLNSKGIINVASIVRNYIYTYFKPSLTQTAFAYSGADNKIDYTIQFGEEYNATTYSNLTSVTASAYNYYQPIFRDWANAYYSNYSWLTNRETSLIDVLYDKRHFITYRQNASATITLNVQRYNGDGTAFGSVQSITNASNLVTIIDVSPAALNTAIGSTFILDTTAFYSVNINSGTNIYLRPICSNRFNIYNVHFLNQLGGYDTVQFYLVSRLSSSVQKQNYERMQWQLNSSDQMKNYNQYNVLHGGSLSYSATQQYSIKLQSDMLSKTNYNWLKELVNTTESYLEYNGFYYPIVIKTTAWEEKFMSDKQNKVISFDADLLQVNSQYR